MAIADEACSSAWCFLRHSKCTFLFVVDSKLEEGGFADGDEVGVGVNIGVFFLNKVERFFELKHRCEFVLAVACAIAVADKPADIAVIIVKLYLIRLCAGYYCPALTVI